MLKNTQGIASKPPISGLSETELVSLVKNIEWPSFKGKQIHNWIYKKWVSSFDEMTDLNLKEREYLKENYILSPLTLTKKQLSKDKTIKYLWELNDGNLIESVRMFMEDHDSYSACISSQAGCAICCPFVQQELLILKRT